MGTPTIDAATFEALKETTGAEFAVELIDTFLGDAPVMLGDLRSALAAQDADRFRRAAHSLKSNGNTFGALTLGIMARELELGGLAAALEGGTARLDVLEQEYARVAAALKVLRNA
jgi:HPt (histidine-containing phosphotransfer) domain-containing protein